ncbi:3'-5' exoribonuclease YhaM family protein [Calycomorphotria hydatis]|uniref:3'-5' exoribonuclease YhaM n=1 Tax=Calycomorphotria hydatis TaxID=2528027 RepID=A0A517TET4_9PLAN|nr:HD domain-containing protein [Calycomorphotria hydatis]QDT66884.1 3'-5' exoribonuclease YhaM [Calycomorphotria hydatis]
MSRKYLNEYQDGDSVDEVFLLAEKTLRANRNANLYLLAQLRDKTGTMSGLQWNVTEESATKYSAGDFVKVKGKVQLYQGGLQMIVTSVKAVPADDLDPEEFHPQPGADVAHLVERLREILLGLSNPHLARLMPQFLDDQELMESLGQAPAGIKAHHAFHGGLLEHVVNILEVATLIEPRYPGLDHDVLKVGVFLHDLGKVRELEYDTTFAYSDEGQLLGHMEIGCEMLEEKIRQADADSEEKFPQELRWHLKHLILSHHGTAEFGSPKVPMTAEAIALHHLDALDAKIFEFSQTIADDPNAESNWTPFNPRLGRKLYKTNQTSQSES